MEYNKMVFNKTNAYMLNSKELSMHDDWLEAFEYDIDNRRAILTFEVDYEWHDGNGNIIKPRDDFKRICGVDTKYIKMIMSDVAAFDVTSLLLWGNGRHVLELNYQNPRESAFGSYVLGRIHKKLPWVSVRNNDGKYTSIPNPTSNPYICGSFVNSDDELKFYDLIEIQIILNSGDELNFLCMQSEFANDPDYKKPEE